jgi:hypothetical protein
LVLTPEEWVRQQILNYLVRVKMYPASCISVEKELLLNDLKRRYDIVVYNRRLEPWLIVECKAPYIALDEAVLLQALRYNLTINAELLMVSNGLNDMVFNKQHQKVELPEYL